MLNSNLYIYITPALGRGRETAIETAAAETLNMDKETVARCIKGARPECAGHECVRRAADDS